MNYQLHNIETKLLNDHFLTIDAGWAYNATPGGCECCGGTCEQHEHNGEHSAHCATCGLSTGVFAIEEEALCAWSRGELVGNPDVNYVL